MNKTENKPEYELSYLLAPDVAEENLNLETAQLQKIISENSGKITESNTPKKRWLAYPVKKQAQAYFGVIYFNADKENIDKIKKDLYFNKKVLRFLILNEPLKKPEPAAAPLKAPAEKIPEAAMPSFDQKLESILNG